MLQAGIITKAVKRVFRAVKSIFPAICFFSRIEPHHKLIATAYQPGAKALISKHSALFLLCRFSLPLTSEKPAATSALMVFLGIRVTEIIIRPLIAQIIRHIAAIRLLSGTRAGSACF